MTEYDEYDSFSDPTEESSESIIIVEVNEDSDTPYRVVEKHNDVYEGHNILDGSTSDGYYWEDYLVDEGFFDDKEYEGNMEGAESVIPDDVLN